MSAPGLVRIPLRFYDDHVSRNLPAPDIVRTDSAGAWIRRDDPALPELISDAEHYAHRYGPDQGPVGLRWAARALLRALRQPDAYREQLRRSAVKFGMAVAARRFAGRKGHGQTSRVCYVHMDEPNLAALIGAAFEAGAEHALAAVALHSADSRPAGASAASGAITKRS